MTNHSYSWYRSLTVYLRNPQMMVISPMAAEITRVNEVETKESFVVELCMSNYLCSDE